MIPAPTNRETTQSGDGRRSGSSRPAPAVPFLKPEDLTQDPQTARIIAISTEKTKFSDVTIKIAFRGKTFFYGVKTSWDDFKFLFEHLGSNENAWVGREFTIGLHFDKFYEKNLIHVFEVLPESAPATTKRK